MVSSQESVDHNVPSDKVQQRVSPQNDITLSQGIDDDSKTDLSKPEEAKSIPSVVVKNEVVVSDTTARALVLSHSSPPEKEAPSPSIIREEVTKDGYNWRKYGQKHVKGNEFIRSYYKCTFIDCQAKKHLKLSNDGIIEDCICIGQHNHPKPQSSIVAPVDCVLPDVEPHNSSLVNVEVQYTSSVEYESIPQQIMPLQSHPPSEVYGTDELEAAHSLLSRKDEIQKYGNPESKRLKKDNSDSDATRVDKSTGEYRVVKSSSDVGFVNDGYRWRKYGQKMVKGNTNPRSYYRCSSPGCPAKKHVERCSQDSKIVFSTYEGQHDHGSPPGRGVTQNTATNTRTPGINGERRSNEKLNKESNSKSKADSITIPIQAIILVKDDLESKLNEKEQQNEDPGTKKDSDSNAMICDSSTEVPSKSNEDVKKDEVKSPSEGTKDCLNVVAGLDTPSTTS